MRDSEEHEAVGEWLSLMTVTMDLLHPSTRDEFDLKVQNEYHIYNIIRVCQVYC